MRSSHRGDFRLRQSTTVRKSDSSQNTNNDSNDDPDLSDQISDEEMERELDIMDKKDKLA